jgi:predicted GTPase
LIVAVSDYIGRDNPMSKKLKTKLIQHCKDTVGNELDGRRPLNIAVIGPPGCGKSSFLNTIFASYKGVIYFHLLFTYSCGFFYNQYSFII